MKVLNDLVTQAGNTNQVTVGAGASGPAIMFGSGSDVVIERVGADTLKLGEGDRLRQGATPASGDDLTNILSAIFLG